MSADHGAVDLVDATVTVRLASAAAVAALTGALAYLAVPYPLSPAPITLQVLGVFVAGIFLGPVWGSAAMGLYLLAGALGAPVFQFGAAGLGHVLDVTGGFLFSYPLAAGVVGAVVHRRWIPRDPTGVGLGWLIGALAAGTVVIYAMGAAWMVVRFSVPPANAVVSSALVFLPAEAAKAAIAVLIARSGVVRAPVGGDSVQ